MPLYLDKHCDKSTLTCKHNHYLEQTAISELVQVFFIRDDYERLDSLANNLRLKLYNLVEQINSLIQYFYNKVKRYKIRNCFMLKDNKDIYDAFLALINNDSEKMKELKCKTIFGVNAKLSQEQYLSTFDENKVYKKIIKDVNYKLNKLVKNFSYFGKSAYKYYKMEKPTLKPKASEGSEPDNFYYTMTSNRHRSPSPSSRSSSRPRRLHVPRRRRSPPPRSLPIPPPKYETYNFVHMRELVGDKDRNRFHVKVKVMKIVKYFTIYDDSMIEWIGADSTAIGTFVTEYNDSIKKGNVIYLTNCRIYMFKGRIPQIQTTPYTKLTPSPSSLTPAKHPNISSPSSSQKPHPYFSDPYPYPYPYAYIKLMKIKDIGPGDVGVCFIGQVLEVQGDGFKCVLGDETGVVTAQLKTSILIRYGLCLRVLNLYSQVIATHIILQQTENSKVEVVRGVRMGRVCREFDVSGLEWISDYGEGDVGDF